MEQKRYIVWSKKRINLKDDFQRKWYIQQVLCHGLAEDIKHLNWEEIKTNIPHMNLPDDIRILWENYFNAER